MALRDMSKCKLGGGVVQNRGGLSNCFVALEKIVFFWGWRVTEEGNAFFLWFTFALLLVFSV
jgi:hypothetical protein